MARKAGTGVVVTGAKELDLQLSKLTPTIQKKAGRKALREAVKSIVLPDAKAMAPVDTGALEKSLTVRATKRSRSSIGYEVVTKDGVFQGDQFYGAFHEFGTKNMPADPFLRPAGYSNRGRLEQKLMEGIKDAIRSLKSSK